MLLKREYILEREKNNMKKLLRTIRKLITTVSPVMSNKIMYRFRMGKKLNLKKPETFNEKINYMKLFEYPKNNLIINCTDKYKVRDYIIKKGLGEILNELYFVYDSVDQINWKLLPKSFVLKCNHGAGYNIICPDKDKLDIEDAKKKLNTWINEDFGKVSAEPHYSKIDRKIICEKYLADDIRDYKFYCFNGKPQFFYVSETPEGSFHNMKSKFFNIDGSYAKFKRTDHEELDKDNLVPNNLNEMLEIAKKLCSEFKFVRVDLFSVNNKVYFSELTFSPCSGFMPFEPEEIDKKYGNLINLEVEK